MSEKTEKLNDRSRNFCCVVYNDSAPDNWLSLLADLKVPAFVSPLHDKDKNADNTPKKPHYHVLIMFEGLKSRSQIQTIFDSFGGVYYKGDDLKNWIRDNVVQSLRSYARYLCHLDNPEKEKYAPEDVIALGGADYYNICSLTVDRYFAIQEMMAFCKAHQIIALTELLDYAAINRFDWFRSLCDNSAFIMKEYIKSLAWYTKEGDQNEN